MLVRWDEKCRVGNEQIDQEHQYLFQLINEFCDAFAEKRERTLVLGLLGAHLQNKKIDGAKFAQPA